VTVPSRPARHIKPDMATWSAAELAAFLTQLRGDRLYAPVLLAAMTGMRHGDVLGCAGATSITLDTYRHAIPAMQASAAVTIARPRLGAVLLGGAGRGP
jgi:hypothetical protein